MTTNLPTTPKPIGGAHAHAPILGMEVRWAEKIGQVCVEFATYDGAQVFSVQLDVAAAAQLAEQLTDAVRTAEHRQDQDTASGGDPEDLPQHEDVATAIALAYDKGWAEGIEHAHRGGA